jgi:hypothetical protein
VGRQERYYRASESSPRFSLFLLTRVKFESQCFVFAGVLAGAYVAWEMYMGERAMTPTAIFKTRSVWVLLLLAD